MVVKTVNKHKVKLIEEDGKLLKYMFHLFYIEFMKMIYKYKKKCIFEEKSRFNTHTLFEGYNKLGYNSTIMHSFLGKGSYIAENTFIKKTQIGRFTCIGPNVRTAIGRHPTKNFVSVHPAFFSMNPSVKLRFTNKQKYEEVKSVEDGKYFVKIGNDVWIGANVTIFDGVTIGDGAIIGAGTIVNQDIPPYAIVVGTPMRIIRYRFEKDEINKLLNLKWWKKDNNWLEMNCDNFDDIKIISQLGEKVRC